METLYVYFKSDFTLQMVNEVDWSTPFRIKFWTTRAVSAMEISYDGETYTGCRLGSDGKVYVPFNNFAQTCRQGLGKLKMEVTYILEDESYPDGTLDQVMPVENVICEDANGNDVYLALGLTGSEDLEISCAVVAAYQRGDTGNSAYEDAVAQGYEGTLTEWLASLHGADADVAAATAATNAANTAATLANTKAALADSAATSANTAASLANTKANLAETAANSANNAATNVNTAAAQANAAAETANDAAANANASVQIATEATQAANNAAALANAKAGLANTAATNANDAASNANTKAGLANTAATNANDAAAAAVAQTAAQATAYTNAEAARNTAYQNAETARGTAYTNAEAARDATFNSKEATRDAANAAALNCAETLTEIVQKIDGLEDRIDGIDARVETMEELFGESVEGYVRVADTSDPEMTFREYKHTKVGEESVFDCYKPCLVGNNFTGNVGKILHILDPLDWYKDENGNTCKLDGSEGEVLICNTKTIYAINGHVSVNGVEYDVFLRSYIPFVWNGHKAEEVKPTGLSPHYCVSHTDDDNVTRMHSVLNMEWTGSWQAQVDCVGKFVATDDGEGNIVETYDEDAAIIGDAMGKSSTNIPLPDGEQRAMNLNEDTTKTIPYYNMHAHALDLHHVGLMLAEGGNWYQHAGARMGSGFSSNVQATSAARWDESDTTASNGFRYIKHDGTTWGYYGFSSNANFGLGTTGDNLYKGCMLNQWRTPWNIFEQQRVLMYAKAHNIAELTWFAFEGSIYKYRSISGLAGLADGVMTSVVWKKLASKLPQGAVEPTTSNDVGGNRCEWLISSAVYRGVITDVSPSWWVSGLWMCQWGTDNHYEAWLCKDQSKMLKSSSSTTIDEDAEYPQEAKDSGYLKLASVSAGNAYRKNFGESLFWPKDEAGRTGGGIGTYVGGYSYLNGTRPAEGKKLSRGFRRGGGATSAYLSPMYVLGVYSPSLSSSSIAFGICCQIEIES